MHKLEASIEKKKFKTRNLMINDKYQEITFSKELTEDQKRDLLMKELAEEKKKFENDQKRKSSDVVDLEKVQKKPKTKNLIIGSEKPIEEMTIEELGVEEKRLEELTRVLNNRKQLIK